MMRVLWVCDYLSITMRQVANGLTQRADIDLEVLGRWSGDSPLDPSIPITTLTCRNKLDFQARKIIRDKLCSLQPDIVFAYTSRNLANVIGACRGLSSIPQLVGYRGTVNRLRTLDPANWITFWHPRVDKIICVCEATNRELQASGISPNKLTTVWEGCDPDSLDALDRTALAEFDIPPQALVVGTVANMRPVKGVDLLLRAACQLSDLRDIYWLLIGEVRDPQVARLAADPRIADRVRLPGPRSAGGRFTSIFDIYVAPSRMEGLSMGIMEAMALQACPVVTKVGGSPELIQDGVDGLVVPPEDSTAIAQAIRRLYENTDLRKQFAESARQRAASVFSIASWTQRHHDLYCELMRQRTAKAA